MHKLEWMCRYHDKECKIFQQITVSMFLCNFMTQEEERRRMERRKEGKKKEGRKEDEKDR